MNEKERKHIIKEWHINKFDRPIKTSTLEIYMKRYTDEEWQNMYEEAKQHREEINSKKIINIHLYGGKPIFGKGKEEPLTTKITRCNMYNQCSLYAKGMCKAVAYRCEHAEVIYKRGFTSRARKYSEFKNKWNSHEMYAHLKNKKTNIYVIGDNVYIEFVNIQFDENNKVKSYMDNWFKDEYIKISKNELTIELIKDICENKPKRRYISGTSIVKDYQKEVTQFLIELKTELPKLYKEFVTKYPKFHKEINYVGKKALLHTTNKNMQIQIFNGKYYWNGTTLKYISGRIEFSTIDGKFNNYNEVLVFDLKPNKDVVVEISTNDQVNDNTVFV
jgi:hypothetical protein